MSLILLEALLALCILIGIVWWTMFSGRSKGELPNAHDAAAKPEATASKTVVHSTAPEDKLP